MFDVKLTAPELASLTTALDHVASCVLLPLDKDGRAELGQLRLKLAGVYLERPGAVPAHDEALAAGKLTDPCGPDCKVAQPGVGWRP